MPHPYTKFLANADGRGTSLDELFAEAWKIAATLGHVHLLMDRDETTGLPYLVLYGPIDTPDWTTDRPGNFTSYKFLETLVRDTLDVPLSTLQYRYRIVDEREVLVAAQDGTVTFQAEHGLGRVPVATLFAKRRPLIADIGQSLFDPSQIVDLFNLTSELRELLRNQTFGILNVPLGNGQTAVSVQDAKAMMGVTSGTDSVLFTPNDAQFLQPDAANVTVYQSEREHVLRTIFRMSAMPYETDSRDSKSADALRLERSQFCQALAGFSRELERAETQICELWFATTYGADRVQAEQERAQITVKWPTSFDATPFDEIAKQALAAQALSYPHDVMTQLKKDLLAHFLPNMTAEQKNQLEKSIDEQPDTATTQQRLLDAAVSGRLPRTIPTKRAATTATE